MKSFLLFSTFLITLAIHAQSNYTSTVMDNPDGAAKMLTILPWDQSKLVQVNQVYDPNSSSNNFSLNEVSSGVSIPISIPSCSEMKSIPTVLNDGILFSGETATEGSECMFFDGVNTTVFDLNLGAGDSYTVVYPLQNRIFLTAYDGNATQLYEFDQVTHVITKITNGAISTFRVCAVWNDAIYYSIVEYNSVTNENEFILMKAVASGSVFSFSTIRSISVPSFPLTLIFWNDPQIKWGKLFLTEDVSSPATQSLPDLRVISLDQNNQTLEVHVDLQSDGNVSKLFEWDNALWTYAGGGGSAFSSELYKSSDGISFNQDLSLSTKSFRDHHIGENNKLYFKLRNGSGLDEIATHYGSLQTLHIGEQLNFLQEENNVLYLSDKKFNDSSAIVLIHTNYDLSEEVKIAPGSFHSTPNASVVFENEFTFLFKYSQTDIDAIKLTGSPQAGLNALSNELLIYPNPVGVGGKFTVESEVEGEFQIYTSDSRVVVAGIWQKGVNEINSSSLRSGVYFVSFLGSVHRMVIK